MITSKATLVLQALHTPELRAKASEKARNHGLLHGTTVHTLGLAQLLKDEGITETFQEFYAQALVAFYDFATTHFTLEIHLFLCWITLFVARGFYGTATNNYEGRLIPLFIFLKFERKYENES